MIVFRYSLGWFFGSVENGDLQMHAMVAKQQSIFAICFFLVLFIVAFLCYMLWTVAVNIPLAMFFITTYLVVYSFFGVFFYEGLGSFSIMTGISNSIDQLEPDLRSDSCKYNLNAPLFSKLWFQDMATYFIEKAKTVVNFLTLSMFEILLLLMLLGGIGLYRKEWAASMAGKVSKGFMEPGSMSETFKQLFFWLIVINVLLIALLIMFLYKKWKAISPLDDDNKTSTEPSQEVNIPQEEQGGKGGISPLDDDNKTSTEPSQKVNIPQEEQGGKGGISPLDDDNKTSTEPSQEVNIPQEEQGG